MQVYSQYEQKLIDFRIQDLTWNHITQYCSCLSLKEVDKIWKLNPLSPIKWCKVLVKVTGIKRAGAVLCDLEMEN